MRRLGLLALCLTLLAAARADAKVVVEVNAETHHGYIGAIAFSSPLLTDIKMYERVDGSLRRLAGPATQLVGFSEEDGPVNYAEFPDVAEWSCERSTRTLVAVGRSLT